MGRDKLTLVGAVCVLTVHSSWNIGAQAKKKKRLGDFCFWVWGFFVGLFGAFVIIFFITGSFLNGAAS